jgi:hypothetical protein
VLDKSDGSERSAGTSREGTSFEGPSPWPRPPPSAPEKSPGSASNLGSESLQSPEVPKREAGIVQKIETLSSKEEFEQILPEIRAAFAEASLPREAIVEALRQSAERAVSAGDLAYAGLLLTEAFRFVDEYPALDKTTAAQVLFSFAAVSIMATSESGEMVTAAGKAIDRALSLAAESGFATTENYGAALRRFTEACSDAGHYELAASYSEFEYNFLAERFGERSFEALMCRIRIVEGFLGMGNQEDALGEALELRHKLPEIDSPYYFTTAVIVEECAADLSLRAKDLRCAYDIAEGAIARLLPLATEETASSLSELFYIRGRAGWRLGLREPALNDVAKALELERQGDLCRPHLRVAMGLWLAKRYASLWEPSKESAIVEELLQDLKATGNGGSPLFREVLVHQMFMFQRERDIPRMKAAAYVYHHHLISHEGPEIEMMQGLQHLAHIWSAGGREDKAHAYEILGEALDILGPREKESPSVTLELLKNRMYLAATCKGRKVFVSDFKHALQFLKTSAFEKVRLQEAELRLEYAECLRIVDEGGKAAQQLRKVKNLIGDVSHENAHQHLEFLVQSARAAEVSGDNERAVRYFARARKLCWERGAATAIAVADLCQGYGEALLQKYQGVREPRLLRGAISMLTQAERLYRARLLDRLPLYHHTLCLILDIQSEAQLLSPESEMKFQARKRRYEERFGVPEGD